MVTWMRTGELLANLIHSKMEQLIRVSGSMSCETVTAFKFGQMDLATKDNGAKTRPTVRAD